MKLDSREFRNALGQFATGICVITANPDGYEPLGMTVNSFASVSIDPPLVLWNLQNNSECYPAFEGADKYVVNILPDNQQPLSDLYAKKGEHALAPLSYYVGKTGCPVLRGALTSFECQVWARYPGGDHSILVGEVLEVDCSNEGNPLLFYSGKYGALR